MGGEEGETENIKLSYGRFADRHSEEQDGNWRQMGPQKVILYDRKYGSMFGAIGNDLVQWEC